MGEREELKAAEGAVQLALGKQVGREQAAGLRAGLPILRLEYIILQLLHVLRRLHIPCEGTRHASGICLHLFPILSSFSMEWTQLWQTGSLLTGPCQKTLDMDCLSAQGFSRALQGEVWPLLAHLNHLD